MTVYLIMRHWDGEGDDIVEAYSNQAEADVVCSLYNNSDDERCYRGYYWIKAQEVL